MDHLSLGKSPRETSPSSNIAGLILKRALASSPSGQWNDDDFDVLAGGAVVGRIFKANAAPVGTPWMWTLAFGHHEDRTPTHGYAESREAAMAVRLPRRQATRPGPSRSILNGPSIATIARMSSQAWLLILQ